MEKKKVQDEDAHYYSSTRRYLESRRAWIGPVDSQPAVAEVVAVELVDSLPGVLAALERDEPEADEVLDARPREVAVNERPKPPEEPAELALVGGNLVRGQGHVVHTHDASQRVNIAPGAGVGSQLMKRPVPPRAAHLPASAEAILSVDVVVGAEGRAVMGSPRSAHAASAIHTGTEVLRVAFLLVLFLDGRRCLDHRRVLPLRVLNGRPRARTLRGSGTILLEDLLLCSCRCCLPLLFLLLLLLSDLLPLPAAGHLLCCPSGRTRLLSFCIANLK